MCLFLSGLIIPLTLHDVRSKTVGGFFEETMSESKSEWGYKGNKSMITQVSTCQVQYQVATPTSEWPRWIKKFERLE